MEQKNPVKWNEFIFKKVLKIAWRWQKNYSEVSDDSAFYGRKFIPEARALEVTEICIQI